MKKFPSKKTSPATGHQPPDQFAYEQEVSRRAYELWESAGRPHGDHTEHWLAAEREVQARRDADGNRLDGFK